MDNAISISGMVKTYGAIRALDGLDMSVRTGEVHGFLGPNGAGKSTTIRVLLGLLHRDAGEVKLLGGDPWRDAIALHRRLAYVPEEVTLWPNLSGGEVIDMLGRMRGGLNAKRKAELFKRFDLDPRKKGRNYSKGNRQKVALVAALASDVELLIMDEPTTGLDPLMEAVFRECIAEEKAKGRTVFLSSHILGEVEVLCDRVTIIRKGRAVESGTLTELRHLSMSAVQAETVKPPSELAEIPGLHHLETEGRRVSFEVEPDALENALRRLTEAGVRSLICKPPSLEELFMRHYQIEEPGRAADGGDAQ